jgi:hypothetical protein
MRRWLEQKIAQHESLAGILSKLDGKEGVALSKCATYILPVFTFSPVAYIRSAQTEVAYGYSD